jgi:ADP-ribosylglycohydrolase
LSNPFYIGNTNRNDFNVDNINKILNEKYDDEILILKMKNNSKSLNSSSLSNGFLMRHTPMTVFLYYYFEINAENKESNYFQRCVKEKQFEELFIFLFNFILGEIQLTHFNVECALAAVVYDFLILSILNNKNQEENGNFYHLVSLNEFLEALINPTKKEIENLKLKKSIQKILESLKEISQMTDFENESKKSELLKVGVDCIGYYMHAMNLTFFIVKFLQNFLNNKEFGIYRNIINFICNKGGDTDTNCCIVGGVIGALIGIKNIEPQYLEPHLKFNPTDENNIQGRNFIYAPSVLTLYGVKLFSVLTKQFNNGNEKNLKESKSEDLSISMIKNILTKDFKKEANKDYPLLSISELI